MADSKELAIINDGVAAWNDYRYEAGWISDLRGADLSSLRLSGADFQNCDLRRAKFDRAELSNSNFSASDLRRATFVNAELFHASAIGAKVQHANFSQANLANAVLAHARLAFANLTKCNLQKAVLTDAKMQSVILRFANLNFANLSRADLSVADLTMSSLHRAELESATLSEARFVEAEITEADFSSTIFFRTNFQNAKLSETTFEGADMGWAIFAGNDLSRVYGLESITHHGPTSIGFDTLELSNGRISELFLRRCGCSHLIATKAKALVEASKQFFSCFISYATADLEFATRLYGDLQRNGVTCYYAPQDMKGGRTIHVQIEDAIKKHDRLLLVLSPASIKSSWVETEMLGGYARQIELNADVFFPVSLMPMSHLKDWKCIDSDTGKDIARAIRQYYTPDFSEWNSSPRTYEAALHKVLSGLRIDREIETTA